MSKQFCNHTRQIYLASCLYDCIEDNNIKAIEKLLTENGADPNIIIPGSGISPFHLAIGNDTNETAEQVTKLLLSYGGNPNVRSEDGLTPVHVAAAWGRVNVLDVLLQFGGQITVKDDDGKLPINYAVEQQHTEVISYLKNVKEGLDKKNHQDKKPYNFILDKVIVNNGFLMAEYGVSINDVNTCSLTYDRCKALKRPPKIFINSYVEEWCYKHANIDNPDVYTLNNLSTESDLNDSASHQISEKDTSDNDINFNIKNIYDSNSVKNNLSTCMGRIRADKSNLAKRYEYSPDKINSYLTKNISKNLSDESVIHILSEESSLHSKENYRESGIRTINTSTSITDGSESSLNKCIIINSSSENNQESTEYMTCEEGNSVNVLDKNILEGRDKFDSNITEDISNLLISTELTNKHVTDIPYQISEQIDSDNESFVSVVEEYKYIDKEEGIVLIEKRILVNPKLDDNKSSISTSTHASSKFSMPPVIDYDTDSLRRELTLLGEPPGPLTKTTKRVYLKKLIRLKKQPTIARPLNKDSNRVYSVELEKTLRNPNWKNDLQSYKLLEDSIVKQFGNSEPTKRWREGLVKASFTYLLMDPRITQNLPGRVEKLNSDEMWKTFLSSIFYVGKGKRSRPYSHLYEAVSYWHKKKLKPKNKKIDYILNIWEQEYGVVCLHVFQNVIPVEAYTREATMISAMKLKNLCNSKSGDFYGISATWTEKQKRLLGVYLLYRAMLIFLNEGERQLRPDDIGK